MTDTFKTIDPTAIPQPELHQWLLSAVAPRPICFASTVDAQGQVNLSPFSFFNVFSSNPPILIFSPARRGRDNSTKDTLDNVKEVPEVVINIVNYPIAEQMSLSSTEYDKGVNEFLKSGLTQVPSDVVTPPRVGESPISFECTVQDIIELGTGGGSGNLVISQVRRMHVNEKYLDGNGKIDTVKMDFISRLGGNWYGRVTPESLFEIPKPLITKGIGVDALPESARNSEILTGNDLGRLGNQEHIPTQDQLNEVALLDEVEKIQGNLVSAHHLVRQWLTEKKDQQALALLFLIDKQP